MSDDLQVTARTTRSGQFHRLVPRNSAPVPFTIDGAPAVAREGDLLLTAILLHRAWLRRFEFGDANRAGFCFMAACQDCWVSFADGSRARACTTLVEPGMEVITDGVDRG